MKSLAALHAVTTFAAGAHAQDSGCAISIARSDAAGIATCAAE